MEYYERVDREHKFPFLAGPQRKEGERGLPLALLLLLHKACLLARVTNEDSEVDARACTHVTTVLTSICQEGHHCPVCMKELV